MPALMSLCIALQGNKLFQSTFIALITNNASQYKQKQYTLLNSTCALVGCEC